MTIIDHAIDHDHMPIAYAMARVMAEIDVLSAMLADPASLYPIAAAAGLRWHHFEGDDTRIIFCATGADHERGALACLKLARIGLQHEGWWDERARRKRLEISTWWSDETLASLPALEANSDVTRWAARRLIELHERSEAATAAYAACLELVGNGEGAGHE